MRLREGVAVGLTPDGDLVCLFVGADPWPAVLLVSVAVAAWALGRRGGR